MEILQEQTFKKAKMKNISIVEKYKSFNPKKAIALNECAKILEFNLKRNTATLEEKLKLACMNSCGDRFCPMCQWRKQLKYSALVFKQLRDLNQKTPLRYIFLTLTVQNCELEHLRATIKRMNQAFQRMSQTKRFTNSVLGSIRVLEFTINPKNKSLHPHFHTLLAVKPSYFNRNTDKYIKQSEWREMWQKALKTNYLPQVNIKIIKSKNQVANESQNADTTTEQAYSAAVAEMLKYPLKDTDLQHLNNNEFKELTKQLVHIRNINCGGIFKGTFSKKLQELENDTDLIHINQEQDSEQWEIIARYIYRFLFNPSYEKSGDYYLKEILPPKEQDQPPDL